MRLLDTKTLRLTSFDFEPYPEYAILSHRWGDEEVTFQELEAGLHKKGYEKIKRFCAEAFSQGFKWAWVDTCCIDKTSSAELSEAINSMYEWYEKSNICLAYLADVTALPKPDGGFEVQGFDTSDWFNRGWTLQELIAPQRLSFYSSDWTLIGEKHKLVHQINRFSKIDKLVLWNEKRPKLCSVAEKMSWVSQRRTSRKEDIAYCLLGLFGIHMPLLYGEGDRAFIRLQEEILKRNADQSIFAWKSPDIHHGWNGGIFAPLPAAFGNSADFLPVERYWDTESSLTNRGVRLRMPIVYDSGQGSYLGILACRATGHCARLVAVELAPTSTEVQNYTVFVRQATSLHVVPFDENFKLKLQRLLKTVYLYAG